MSLSLREGSQLLCQLKVLDQKITKVFEEQVGLSLTRYELLMILKERQPCLQTEIQEHLKIDSGAVTRHLKILEEKQYVTRQRNPENNREVLVHLTEKAQQELQQCTAKQQTVTEIIPSTFTKDDCRQLKELLTKLDQSITTKEV